MRTIILLFVFISQVAFAQLTIDDARQKLVTQYHIGASTYFADFVGHAGYGAVCILTADGGAAAFGDGDEGTMVYKLKKEGTMQFKKKITPKGDEMECQAVVEDKAGNLYLYMLVYDHAKYRGGNERVICISKAGVILWDKYLGAFSSVNNPIVSWIRKADDGTVAMRGHIAPVKAEEGKDPVYKFWDATINSKGVVIAKIGDVIDWAKPEWQKKFKPEN